VFGAQAAGVLAMRETAPRRPGAVQSLRPDIRLPSAARKQAAIAAPVLFAVWALAGLLLHRPGKAPAAAPVTVGCESSR